jgi:uncharacterized small protein (DUF1192 family)
MIINTTAIKNLSVAYEALAHASGVEDLQQRIQFLLTAEITRAEDRVAQQNTKTTTDDDIPF